MRTSMTRLFCFTNDQEQNIVQTSARNSIFGATSFRRSSRPPTDKPKPMPDVRPPLPDSVVEAILQNLSQAAGVSELCSALRVCKQFARVGAPLLPPRPESRPIPDEILLEIFTAVRYNSSSEDPVTDLASSVRACKQWYRAGMPLLYKSFVIDVNYKPALCRDMNSYSSSYFPIAKDRYDFIPSARFYDTATKLWSQPWTDSGLGAWITSLSVEIHFHEPSINQPHKHSMTDIVKELPHIKTFSVRAAPLRQNNELARANFTDLIQNLPPQIINFELDLQSRDTAHGTPPPEGLELCRALAKVVPQLRTLRLRLASMCIIFLEQLLLGLTEADRSCPNLRALSISLYNKEFTVEMPCCSHRVWTTSAPPSVTFMDALQARITEGSLFPNLKACSLVCLRHDMAAHTVHTSRVICKAFNHRLRTWNKRAYFPRTEGFSPSFYVRTDPDGDETEAIMARYSDLDFATYMTYFKESAKVYHSRKTDALFEGEAGWIEDAFGARYPPMV